MSETIQELDAEIARLDAAMAALVLQQQTLKRRRNSLTFINRCPDEILVEIFMIVHACEVDKVYCHYPGALVGFSRTCTRWAAVAMSTPRLWSLIDLNYRPTAVERMLALSAAHDLELWAAMRDTSDNSSNYSSNDSSDDSSDDSKDDYTNENLTTIVCSVHCNRVRILDLDVGNCIFPSDISELIRILVPALTSLRRLNLYGFTESSLRRLGPGAFREMPRLCQLYAAPIYPAGVWRLPSLVSLKLTRFVILSAGELLHFLQATAQNCPNLKRLEIRGTTTGDLNGSAVQEYAHFQSLETIFIRLSSPQMLDAVVSCLSVRATCAIHLSLIPASTPFSVTLSGIRAYTERHQWTIAKLELKVKESGTKAYVYDEVGQGFAPKPRMTLRLQHSRPSRDWEKHQTMIRSLWELFPRENVVHACLKCVKTWKDPVEWGSLITRKAGEAWPVEDVLAELLARVTPESRAIVADEASAVNVVSPGRL